MDRDPQRILYQLQHYGWSPLPAFAPQQAAEIAAHLQARRCYGGYHVRYKAPRSGSWDELRTEEYVCHHHEDVLTAPHLLEYALPLTGIVAAHLKCETPVLYSVNAFWTRPGQSLSEEIQDWHQDNDDDRFLAMFVYLTDVDERAAQQVTLDGKTAQQIVGPAGTAFFSDTSQLHRGLKPPYERGLLWFRWGVSDKPRAYEWDQLYPIDRALLGARYPDDERLQRSLRLLVA